MSKKAIEIKKLKSIQCKRFYSKKIIDEYAIEKANPGLIDVQKLLIWFALHFILASKQ